MAKPKLSYEVAAETAKIWMEVGCSRTAAAKKLNIPPATLDNRLIIAAQYGVIPGTTKVQVSNGKSPKNPRLDIGLKNGIIVVGSDAHYWPGIIAPAHKAFVRMLKELKPDIVVMNGDVVDGAKVSRHPPIGWEERPSMVEEIEACKERLFEIEEASKKSRRIWTMGNHDGRFETRLATVASEYARVHGFALKDHFPLWETCWSVWVNDDVVIKHRYKGGIHATHNNTATSGKTMVTGHLHSLKVNPWTDYNGTRYGVDTGTLAETAPVGPQFASYLEDNPVNWRAGFAVLTFKDGELLWPEVVHVMDTKRFEFRGKVYGL